jgi:nickel/cobalt exporter
MVLAATAASIGFIHTLLGPDHYLPFIVMAKTRRWSLTKALSVTALCGLGHVASSVTLGAIGITMAIAVGNLEFLEAIRGDWAAWALIAFGMTYFAWGLKKAFKDRAHTHTHHHSDGKVHSHGHNHHEGHVHVHEAKSGIGLTPWALFVIFVLGPCEPLIPILMYPASQAIWGGVVAISAIFGIVTLLTMTGAVALALIGLQRFSLGPVARFSHALAGGAVAMSGGAIVVLGV